MRALKRFSPNPPLPTENSTIFPSLDTRRAADQIETLGFYSGICLPEPYVDKIIEYCRTRRLKNYENPHLDCDAVDRIARDPKIVEIARRYLGVEPILYGTRMYWSIPKRVNKNCKESWASGLKRTDFHFDVGDFKSLSLFIYLTDVDLDSGPHILIEGTHRKTFKELLAPSISYTHAVKRFRQQIRVVMGRKGTIFFEDLNAYHQHSPGLKPRLVLTILYLFHRTPPILS
jgi:hypothetical protein